MGTSKKISVLTILITFVLNFFIIGQDYSQQKFSFTQDKQRFSQTNKNKSDQFVRIEKNLKSENEGATFYPISNGDFWEYLVEDTTSIFEVFYTGLYFSVIREVINDTIMSNSISYKIIRWEYFANSVSYDPWCDFHRVDISGNVHLFYNDQDYLLFDVNSPVGTTYSSHLAGKNWLIEDRYNVIGFGDTLFAIDYALFEGTVKRETYTLVENFGIIHYQKGEYNFLPEGNLWGSIINSVKYGNLIATKDEVDWSEFYPLHLGNYWVYEGYSHLIPVLRTVRIIGDTILQDGYQYKIAEAVRYSPNTGVSYYFTRIDSIGRIWSMETWATDPHVEYQLSISVGDMFLSYLTDFYWRTQSKSIDIFLYPDLINYGVSIAKGLGITYISGEMIYEYLRGAFINGLLLGDTLVTGLKDISIENYDFYLAPNYPNPFNSTTKIKFIVNRPDYYVLSIMDITGKLVVTLSKKFLNSGEYLREWDGNDATNNMVSSGVYILSLRSASGNSLTRKVLLIK